MNLRLAEKEDWAAVWPIFRDVVRAGETYAYDPGTAKEQAEKIRFQAPRQTWVFEDNGEILGTYYLKSNQAGPGSHVCNCGYMVSPQALRKD